MATAIEPRNMETTGYTKTATGLVDNMRLKLGAEKAVIQHVRIERERESYTKKPVPRSKRIAKKLASKSRGYGSPSINQHRQTEKGLMTALRVKNRKQLRKYRKQQTKLKMTGV